jgi:hypothetical protein
MTDDYEIPAGEAGLEPGTYLATLTALKPFTLYETTQGWTRERPDDGIVEAYNKIAWHFATDDGDTIESSTSTSRSERSTLYAWATGLGLPAATVLDRSKPIPAALLIGREGMITVVLDKNGYSKVASVVPAPKAKPKPGEFAGVAPTPSAEALPDELPFK